MTTPPAQPQSPQPPHLVQSRQHDQDDQHDWNRAHSPYERQMQAAAASPSSPFSSSAAEARDPAPAESVLPVISPRSAQRISSSVSGGQSVQRSFRREQSAREDVAVRAARVKHACCIEDVVSRYGVELTPVAGGRRLVGLCPFHAEQHGSFTVYADTQSFCCFGCHAAGDVITFVCLFEHVQFNEALRLLGESQEHERDGDDGASSQGHPVQRLAQLAQSASRASRASRASPASPVLAFSPRLVTTPRILAAACPLEHAKHAEHLGECGDHVDVPADQSGPQQAYQNQSVSSSPSSPRSQGDDTSADQNGRADEIAPAPEHDEASAALRLTLLSVTTALAMQGLTHAPSALAYLGERGISLALARRCRLGYLHDAALLEYLAGDGHLERVAREVGLLNRLGRGTLARRLIVPELRDGRATQLIGRTLPGAQTPLPHVKYYVVCSNGEKGLLGYGAALKRLATGTTDPRQRPRGPGSSQQLRGILVLEGALDYVIAIGWNLPVLPVALLSTYPSRAQLRELLDLRVRAGDVPLLLMQDADSAGREGMKHLARVLSEQQVPFSVVPPVSRPPAEVEPAYYKDLAELGPLGRPGRLRVLEALARTPLSTFDLDTMRDEPPERQG